MLITRSATCLAMREPLRPPAKWSFDSANSRMPSAPPNMVASSVEARIITIVCPRAGSQLERISHWILLEKGLCGIGAGVGEQLRDEALFDKVFRPR